MSCYQQRDQSGQVPITSEYRIAVEKIHAAGIEAGVWTVNDEAAVRRFLEMGVDRIYTDFPKRLLRLQK